MSSPRFERSLNDKRRVPRRGGGRLGGIVVERGERLGAAHSKPERRIESRRRPRRRRRRRRGACGSGRHTMRRVEPPAGERKGRQTKPSQKIKPLTLKPYSKTSSTWHVTRRLFTSSFHVVFHVVVVVNVVVNGPHGIHKFLLDKSL